MFSSIRVCEDCQSPFISAKLVRNSGLDPLMIEAECPNGHSVFFIPPTGQQYWPIYSDWPVHSEISHEQSQLPGIDLLILRAYQVNN